MGQPRYLRAHLRVGVVLVAKANTIFAQGITPYIEAARINIDQNHVNALYLVVWEKPHLSQWRTAIEYAKKCRQLRHAMKAQLRLEEHFSCAYTYVDPNGYRRDGQISRYVVTDVGSNGTVSGTSCDTSDEPSQG